MRLKRKPRCFDCKRPRMRLIPVYVLVDKTIEKVCRACWLEHYERGCGGSRTNRA